VLGRPQLKDAMRVSKATRGENFVGAGAAHFVFDSEATIRECVRDGYMSPNISAKPLASSSPIDVLA
jgi:hypothetical protein